MGAAGTTPCPSCSKELIQFAGHSDIHVAMRYQEAVSERKKALAHRMTELARDNWSDDVSQTLPDLARAET